MKSDFTKKNVKTSIEDIRNGPYFMCLSCVIDVM